MGDEQSRSLTLIGSDTKRQQAIDIATASFKGILSQIPIAGPLLGEVLGVYIPNRRLERVITMLEMFAQKIEHLEESVRQTAIQSDHFATLLEEGVLQAARSISQERRAHIAAFLANALPEEERLHLQQRRLLELLGSINDAELLTLAFYSMDRSPNKQQAFAEIHRDTIFVQAAVFGDDDEAVNQEALQRTYRANLVRLGLLTTKFKKPKKGQLPDLDLKTGMVTASGYKITHLGRLLLQYTEATEASSAMVEPNEDDEE